MDKRRFTAALGKNFADPIVKIAVALRFAAPTYAILETTGRKSGRRRRIQVGNGLDGNTFRPQVTEPEVPVELDSSAAASVSSVRVILGRATKFPLSVHVLAVIVVRLDRPRRPNRSSASTHDLPCTPGWSTSCGSPS